jgi:hypothetical protein
MTSPTNPIDPQALETAACEYDDANAYQTIPERDAAYRGFLAGIRWLAARDVWTPMSADSQPGRPGYYQVTKTGKAGGRVGRVCGAAWWDGRRFLSAANVLAWRPLSEPWAGGATEDE